MNTKLLNVVLAGYFVLELAVIFYIIVLAIAVLLVRSYNASS